MARKTQRPHLWKSYVQPYKQGRIQATADIYAGDLSMLCRFSGSVSSQSRLSGTNLARGRVMGLLVTTVRHHGSGSS